MVDEPRRYSESQVVLLIDRYQHLNGFYANLCVREPTESGARELARTILEEVIPEVRRLVPQEIFRQIDIDYIVDKCRDTLGRRD